MATGSRMTLGIIAAGLLMAAAGGCGSNWRLHDERVVTNAAPSVATAPSWVRGNLAQFRAIDPDRVYFVGRSESPDAPRSGGQESRTPDQRTGFTTLDEREAVQSARNDVYDQIRQRLQPRNFGLSAQVATATVDSGTCIDCGTEVGALRTSVQQPCNADCGGGLGTQAGGSGCCKGGSFGGQQHGSLTSACKAGCSVAGSAATTRPVPTVQDLARDLNIVNIGMDSIMPALLAKLEEDEIYFEKWHVLEGLDSFGRPFATGRDEWQSYKAWILCSIPRDEFEQIAEEFRTRYNELYEVSMGWMLEDRERRLTWESRVMEMQLSWQDEERSWSRSDKEMDRKWDREDEQVARDHAISVDLDRQPLPRRRFTVLGRNE